MVLARVVGLDQADDRGASAAVEGADHLHPAHGCAGRAGVVRLGERQPNCVGSVGSLNADLQAVVAVFRYVAAQNRDQTTAAQRAGEPHQQKGAVASFQYFAGPPRDILAGRGDHRGDIRSQQGSGGAGRRAVVVPASVIAETAWRTAAFAVGEGCWDMRWRSAIAATHRRIVADA